MTPNLDPYDAVQDARSEALYEEDPQAEKDDEWREPKDPYREVERG